MKRTIGLGAAAALVALTLALAGCGTTHSASGPSVAACKTAMTSEYAKALSSGAQGTEPPACKGLPASTLSKLAGQIITAPASQVPTANVQTCQDFAKQLSWLEARKATVTLVDIADFGGWLQMDAGSSTGKLHTDMSALSSAYQAVIADPGSSASAGNLVVRVAVDCADLGVNVKPPSS